MIAAILIAVLIPCLFLFVIWSLEIYAMSRVSVLAIVSLWGLVAFGLSLIIQNLFLEFHILTFAQITRISAPFLEEGLKAGIFIWLVRRMLLRYAVDGTVYGFAVGTAFAVAENLLYIAQSPGSALDSALGRVLSVSLMHAFNTAFVGTVAGFNIYRGERVRVRRVVSAFVLVILMHAVFNRLVTDLRGEWLIVLSITIGLTGTAVIVLIMHSAFRAESQLIDGALADLVNAGERAAVLNPQQLAQILVENQKTIDPRHAKIIQEFIALRAREGVLRKTLMLNERHKYRRMLGLQLKNVELQLQALRSEMGFYTWIWLRTVFPSEESALWSKLDVELGGDQNPVLGLLVKLNDLRQQISHDELETRVTLLQSVELFQGLDHDDLEDVALSLNEQNYAQGDIIVAQGQVLHELYCVASGRVVISIADDQGQQIALWEQRRGEIFGQFSMMDDQPHRGSVYCVENATVYALPREDFITLIYAKPQIALLMLRLLMDEIRKGSAQLIMTRRPDAKLASRSSAVSTDL